MRACIAGICLLVSACTHSGNNGSVFSRFMNLFGRETIVGDRERGKTIAQEKCAPCHAQAAAATSAHGASSFPELATRAALTTARLHLILSRLPHPMPPIVLDNQAAEDLISYLRTSAIGR